MALDRECDCPGDPHTCAAFGCAFDVRRWALGQYTESDLAEAVIRERAALALDREGPRTALDRKASPTAPLLDRESWPSWFPYPLPIV